MNEIRHIGITVNSLVEMMSFYSKLGFNKISSCNLEEGKVLDNFSDIIGIKVWTLKLTNFKGEIIELLEYKFPISLKRNKKKKINCLGISHIALTVKDINNIYKNLRKFFIYPPQVSNDGKVLISFIRDVENNLIELVEEKK